MNRSVYILGLLIALACSPAAAEVFVGNMNMTKAYKKSYASTEAVGRSEDGRFEWGSILSRLSEQHNFDKKFLSEASREVWASNNPIFDPAADIDPALSDGQGAVIIANSVLVDADRQVDFSRAKRNELQHDVTNLTAQKVIQRQMAKILDESAIPDFSTMTLPQSVVVNVGGYELASTRYAVGARVYKADGNIIDVDVAAQIPAKKNGNEPLRVEIPGLSVGDVVDMYTYAYELVDELSPMPFVIWVGSKYPIAKYEFVGITNPELDLEYINLNGAPLMNNRRQGGRLSMNMMAEKIPGYNESLLMQPARQLPGYAVSVYNVSSELVKLRPWGRQPGLYPNPKHDAYKKEIQWQIAGLNPDSKLEKKTVSYLNDYSKKHPGESNVQRADRAFIAMMYFYNTDPKRQLDSKTLARTYQDILHKQNIDTEASIGYVNGRDKIDAQDAMDISQVDIVVQACGKIYPVESVSVFVPGEAPGLLQGESGVAFYGELSQKTETPLTTAAFNVPTTTFSNNVLSNQMVLRLATDQSYPAIPVIYERKEKATGAMKSNVFAELPAAQWIRAAETYLEIPEKQAFKISPAEQEEADKALLDRLYAEAAHNLGVEPKAITKPKVTAWGAFPDSDDIEIESEGVIAGIAQRGPNGTLVLNIGKLLGNNVKVEGMDRKRKTDAIVEAPEQLVFNYTVEVPDGYKVDTESLASFDKSIENAMGALSSQAQTSEDGRTVTITVVKRINVYVVPAKAWTDFLALQDAATAINAATIVFLPE